MGLFALGIDDHAADVRVGLLNPGDQFTFVVGLPEVDTEIQPCPAFAYGGLNLRERGSTIQFRLANTEHIQIGTVEAQKSALRHIH